MTTPIPEVPRDHRARDVERRYAARLLILLLVSVTALQLANWWSAHRLTDEVLVDQEVASWDSFVDLIELYAGLVDTEEFGATFAAVTEVSSERGDEDSQGESISWHTAERDVAVAGAGTRTPAVDRALDGQGTQIEVRAGALEHVRALATLDGEVALRYESDLGAVETASERLQARFAVIGLLAGIGAVGLFFALGGFRLVRSHGRVADQALSDPLTGLGNHRAFSEDLDRAIRATARHHEPLTVVMLDVDWFKRVNDDHGHRAGDDTLCAIATVLTGLRADDRTYRLGGDEFAILVPGTDFVAARAVADRLRAETRDRAGVTVSVGLAVTHGLVDPDDLWRRADRALYRAKDAGRDTTVLAEAPAG